MITSTLVPAAAHQVIAARLSGDTQCSDEAAGLYIDTVTVGPEGVLEVTVSDEHGASLAVTLASPGQPSSDTRTVQIPARDDHDGRASIIVTLPWVCPSCGGPRGEVKRVVSYDGSRRLACDGWENPCGYVDSYAAVRREATEFAQSSSCHEPVGGRSS